LANIAGYQCVRWRFREVFDRLQNRILIARIKNTAGVCIMSKLALYVPLEAKPGKEKEVAEFLKSAVPLVEAEPGTVTWFAIQEGPSSFAIFDTFDDETGRNAHLNGKVAATLMAKAGELLAKAPAIHKIEILADKLPK
jgi:quinol monooxygenase YgiN